MKRIAGSEYLPAMARFVFPNKSVDEVRAIVLGCATTEDFQARVMLHFNEQVIENSIATYSYSGIERLARDRYYLFVSNHRDIVLDASLLSQALYVQGFRSLAITFGSNLMSSQLLIDIGKSNKMFKVVRNDIPREFYKNSLHLSEYIRQLITAKQESVWIAQRNGRTKNGNDATEQGLIKMFCMSGGSDLVQAVDELNVVPVAVSYEWEPCDMLKTKELLHTRNGEKYVKQKDEDFISVLTGITQAKGNAHFAIGEPLRRDELLPLRNGAAPNVFYKRVADLLDARIYSIYRLHASNYVAHDLRSSTSKYADKYSSQDKEKFLQRLKCAADEPIFLNIYANPVDKCCAREADICVLIPAYNNAATLPQVLRDVLQHSFPVVVVNDGSTDSTAEVLRQLLRQLDKKIDVIAYPKNRGKGYALRKGFDFAAQKGYRYVLTIDADGQHYAGDIPLFVNAAKERPDSLLVGSRILKQDNMPHRSTFANRFSNFWFALQTGRSLPDTQSGFRLYPLRRMKRLRSFSSRYEAELEMLVRCAWRNIGIASVPIRVRYAPKGERVSHYRPVADGARISLLNTLLCLLALVYGYPAKAIRAAWRALRLGGA
ncbi:MAG: glycosyltransferase [Prevotellaceae bacterium]|nr:glycosyltransferase [Prevotellaceae bacterium]